MTMIPDEVIEQVRDGADLVSIIGESVDLRRTGADYRGPCPFHGGQHRNFAVIPRKGRYYCFVCKASGDVFSWYMNRVGLDYPSAVREVARSLGIPIPESRERAGPDPREPLFQAVSVAHDWFVRQLAETAEADAARQYLVGRALDPEELAPLQLGYAPRATSFLPAMAQLGLAEAVLLEAGLIARREDGTVAPRFRGRLLFPIHDLRGRVVGFGGRLLGQGEPKYLNSPESPIFHKGATLYNLHAARNAIRKEERAILVEGYFDVLRLSLAGIDNVVAPLGTAMTADQSALLKRFTSLVLLLFDSDQAGLRATFRAGDELLRCGLRAQVVTLPPGEDPDTLVQRGGREVLEPLLRDAVDVVERKIQLLDRKGFFSDVPHRREALDRLLPTLRATADPIQRDLYLTLVAERTGVERRTLEAELERAVPAERPPQAAPSVARAAEPRPDPRVRWGRTERQLLRLLLASTTWRDTARQQLTPELFREGVHREMFERLRDLAVEEPPLPPEAAPETLRARWASYRDAGAPVAETAADQFYADAVSALESRPHMERLLELAGRLLRADPEQLPDLMREAGDLRRLLRSRFSRSFQTMYPLLRGHRRARGAPPDPRPSER